MKYSDNHQVKKHHNKLLIFLIIVIILAALVVGGMFFANKWYKSQLLPVSTLANNVTITIPEGSTASQIGKMLQEQKLIKNAKVFELYVRNNNLRDSLQAGQYSLSPSQSLSEIALVISSGKVQKSLFTILPAQRIDQIKTALLKAGYSDAAVSVALDPATYKNHPALVAKPTAASLEGYLYPESFQTTQNTTPTDIIKLSLDEMAEVLTPEIIDQFQKQGLGIHRAVTLASIVEKEVPSTGDRRMVAGVFYNRLRAGIALGSDVTYHYAAIINGVEPSPDINSPYNTRKYKDLPPGPISNVSKSSLSAVAKPIESDYLFFVSGDDGKTYFSKTIAEHEALAAQHCKVLCSTY